jgi:hypothetical protein
MLLAAGANLETWKDAQTMLCFVLPARSRKRVSASGEFSLVVIVPCSITSRVATDHKFLYNNY